jgi:hypothetical protein
LGCLFYFRFNPTRFEPPIAFFFNSPHRHFLVTQCGINGIPDACEWYNESKASSQKQTVFETWTNMPGESFGSG